MIRTPLTLSILATCGLAACCLVAGLVACSAGGDDRDYEERMAREHQDDEPAPAAAAAREAEVAAQGGESANIVSQRVVYATVGGAEVSGYLARPAAAELGAPGLIVIHEWWGLNDNVETMARMFAHAGYAALAVDLYGGQVAETPEGARGLMEAANRDRGRTEENLRQAYAYLSGTLGAPAVGVIGWCFGGGWALETALLLPADIDATVIYYGRLITDRDALARLQMPVLGLFGAEDRGIPVEQVREFEAALAALGKRASIHVYPGADHAFANPSGTRYQPEAARDAWERTLAFLARHLRGGGRAETP